MIGRLMLKTDNEYVFRWNLFFLNGIFTVTRIKVKQN